MLNGLTVIGDALPPSLVRAAFAVWPDVDWRGWHRYESDVQAKYATRDASQIPRAALECHRMMAQVVDAYINREAFPDWDMHGSGMHMMVPGDFVGAHLDSDSMRSTGWRRRYSCVLCCNPRWGADWGGEFRLLERVVPARFNQIILFETTDESVHEVYAVEPDAFAPRCTLSLFYWSTSVDGPAKRPCAEFGH